MRLDGCVAIVTGSASGVGAATARMLAARGCRVVVNYTRSEADAEAIRSACVAAGAEAMLCRADVAEDADCRRMVAMAVDRWGRLDVLVNSAGTSKLVPHASLDGLSADDFRRIYAVNAIGPFQMMRAAAPHLRATGNAAVVNVSSGAGIGARGSSIAYAASKAALNNLTLQLARVLAPEVRVNTVCPALIEGRWMRTMLGDRYETHLEQARARNPLRRVCTADDVARTILWLIADAGTLTGECLSMDGGQHLI